MHGEGATIPNVLVEGSSLRSASRITGASITVAKLLVDAGEVCIAHRAGRARGVAAARVLLRSSVTRTPVIPSIVSQISEIASLLRASLGGTGFRLFVVVFSAMAGLRFAEVESRLVAQDPFWALELGEPAAWAVTAGAAWGLVSPLATQLRLALSPAYRFRQLKAQADALAVELSDRRNFYAVWAIGNASGGGEAKPNLQAKIGAFAAALHDVGLRPLPPIHESRAWEAIVPGIRAYMGSRRLGLADLQELFLRAQESGTAPERRLAALLADPSRLGTACSGASGTQPPTSAI